MKKISLSILRLVVYLIGVGVLAIVIFAIPPFVESFMTLLPDYKFLHYPVLINLMLTVIPFLYALYQSLKLLYFIDRSSAFSILSVKALLKIKYCAIAIAIMYGALMPVIFLAADADDAPGLILFGMVFVLAPIIIATFAAILQGLLQEAIQIKLENELTI